jgi:photosystem II stability/assembly factor-like uncharacterized protein
MSIRRFFPVPAFFLIFSLTSCSLLQRPADPAAAIPFGEGPPGRWEETAELSYYEIPEGNLKGRIGPAYLVYMVTLAGFHDERYGVTVGPDDDVRYTADGGKTWTKSESVLHCRHGLEIVDEKTAWHCGNGGTRVSTDGGRTWTTVAPSPCPSLSFLDSRTGWAASPYLLQATADGGAAWTTLAAPVGGERIAAVALSPAEEGFVLDEGGNLFVTGDGGQTWDARSIGLQSGERLVPSDNGPRAALRFVDDRHGLVVFDLEDRSVWFAVTADGGRTWQRAEITALRNQATYYQVYVSRDGSLLTATNDFNNGTNSSLIFRYVAE